MLFFLAMAEAGNSKISNNSSGKIVEFSLFCWAMRWGLGLTGFENTHAQEDNQEKKQEGVELFY